MDKNEQADVESVSNPPISKKPRIPGNIAPPTHEQMQKPGISSYNDRKSYFSMDSEGNLENGLRLC